MSAPRVEGLHPHLSERAKAILWTMRLQMIVARERRAAQEHLDLLLDQWCRDLGLAADGHCGHRKGRCGDYGLPSCACGRAVLAEIKAGAA